MPRPPSTPPAPPAASCRQAETAWVPILLRALALAGYGIWMLLGTALMLGVYRNGRGGVLVPLALGAAFVGAGLAAAALGLPGAGEWHGWRPTRDVRPGREAMLALGAYLPMLAVAGLAWGDDVPLPTRAAGAALALCSFACLIHAGSFQRGDEPQRFAGMQPFSSVVAAGYAGGLWLWLCLAAQDDASHPTTAHPWIGVLVMFALLLGLTEGIRWQSLRNQAASDAERWPARFLAAAFTYAVPCVLLLLDDRFDFAFPVLALAALSCLLGQGLEQRVYALALARRER